MILVGMIRTDETAVICDLAETYGVLNYRALPLKTVAALCSGLRDDSRIKLKLADQLVDNQVALLAAAVDRLTTLVWFKTRDGEKGRNRPQSILAQLMADNRQENKDYESFRSVEEFEEMRKKLFSGGE